MKIISKPTRRRGLKVFEVFKKPTVKEDRQITAQEFDNLRLTAKQFDSKGITAKEFDTNAYNILGGIL